jgi:peptide/nickel transport system permease protein
VRTSTTGPDRSTIAAAARGLLLFAVLVALLGIYASAAGSGSAALVGLEAIVLVLEAVVLFRFGNDLGPLPLPPLPPGLRPTRSEASSAPSSPIGRFRRDLLRVRQNLPLFAGILLLGFFVVIALAAPLFYPGTDPNSLPWDPAVYDGCALPQGPSLHFSPLGVSSYPLGQTAHFGFDVLQGLLLGTRWDLLILGGLLAFSATVGAFVGAVAGTVGGVVDAALSAVFDGFLSFPPFIVGFLVLVLFPLVAPSFVPSSVELEAFYGTLAAVFWVPFATAVRAQARMVARRPYVEAARASGASPWRIVLDHVLPNCSTPILAQIPSTLGGILLVMGGFQYVGLSQVNLCRVPVTQPPGGAYLLLPSFHFPEWTYLLANGALGWAPPGTGLDEWWGYLIPTAWILLFLLAATLICDGLVSYLSPYRHS